MKKILSILLILALVLSFASCNGMEAGGDSTSESSTSAESESPAESSTDRDEEFNESVESNEPNESEESKAPQEPVLSDLVSDIDIDDKDITIVHWNEAAFSEFFVSEEDVGDNIVLNAVYERNHKTEELLGIKLNFEHNGSISSSIGSWFNMWCDTLQNMMSDPEYDVDVFACYSKALATATIRGLNKDVSELSNIDLSREWWPRDLGERSSIGGGKIYYLTGEISPNAVYNMYTVFYNKDTLSGRQADGLSKLVGAREWTVDKMIELSSGIYSDLDGAEGKSAGDSFGLSMSWWAAESLVRGAGFTLAEDGGAEEPIKLSSNLYSKEFSDFIKKLSDFCKNDGVFNDPNYSGEASAAFYDGRSAFFINIVGASVSMNETDVDYGILPMPLLNSEQGEYIIILGNTYSSYSIARSCDDDETAAALLTAFAYYGHTLVTPAVYEYCIGEKYSEGGDTADVFKIMLDGMCSDTYSVYARELRTVGDIPSTAICYGTTFEEKFSVFEQKALERDLGILNGKLKNVIS